MYTDYRMNDQNVKDYQKYERTIKTIKSDLKHMDMNELKHQRLNNMILYSKVISSINQKEMIKVIDRTGEVSYFDLM